MGFIEYMRTAKSRLNSDSLLDESSQRQYVKRLSGCPFNQPKNNQK